MAGLVPPWQFSDETVSQKETDGVRRESARGPKNWTSANLVSALRTAHSSLGPQRTPTRDNLIYLGSSLAVIVVTKFRKILQTVDQKKEVQLCRRIIPWSSSLLPPLYVATAD